MHVIPEPNVNNQIKAHLVALPGFDVERFPFIACSGSATINLINVRDAVPSTEKLIKNVDSPGQRGLFFRKEHFGYSLHFTIRREID